MSTTTLFVNGARVERVLDTRTTLLDLLRDHLGLTGAKLGCGHGQCGACTVLVDGRRVLSCLLLAVTQDGSAVTTIEGLTASGDASAIQDAFVAHDALQCGFCTPGQICSAVGMLAEAAEGSPSSVTPDLAVAPLELHRAEISERMSGNLCRCAAYPNIVAAIETVA